MGELEDKTYIKILELSNKAERYFENTNYRKALEFYFKALELIPIPKSKWEASTWLYSGIGDSYYLLDEYELGEEAFYDALNCPNGHNSPFLYLRLGQCQFELEKIEKAENNLMAAYMLEGEEIFQGEKKKYFSFLSEKYNL